MDTVSPHLLLGTRLVSLVCVFETLCPYSRVFRFLFYPRVVPPPYQVCEFVLHCTHINDGGGGHEAHPSDF